MLNKIKCICPDTTQINICEGLQIQNDDKGGNLHESVAFYQGRAAL
jgi:hypothetical protein